MRSGELNVGVGEAGAGIRDGGFLLLHRSLERAALQPIQKVALVNLGAFLEQALVEKGGDAGGQGHSLDRLNAADEFGGFGDRGLLHADDANRRRAAGHLSGSGRRHR